MIQGQKLKKNRPTNGCDLEGGEPMSEDNKAVARRIAEAMSALPNEKCEFLIGYAEGAIAMAATMCPPQRESA